MIEAVSLTSVAIMTIGTAMVISGVRVGGYDLYLSWRARRRCQRRQGPNGRFA